MRFRPTAPRLPKIGTAGSQIGYTGDSLTFLNPPDLNSAPLNTLSPVFGITGIRFMRRARSPPMQITGWQLDTMQSKECENNEGRRRWDMVEAEEGTVKSSEGNVESGEGSNRGGLYRKGKQPIP